MLTVKHVQPSGHEEIYPAARVSYQPQQTHPDNSKTAECVFIDTPKGETFPLGSFGAFYVMNEAGKTVSKYDLGGWGVPSINDESRKPKAVEERP